MHSSDAGLNMPHMKGQPMLQCMHTLEEAGKAFGTKKLQDLSELGKLMKVRPDFTRLLSTLAMQYWQWSKSISICPDWDCVTRW